MPGQGPEPRLACTGPGHPSAGQGTQQSAAPVTLSPKRLGALRSAGGRRCLPLTWLWTQLPLLLSRGAATHAGGRGGDPPG